MNSKKSEKIMESNLYYEEAGKNILGSTAYSNKLE